MISKTLAAIVLVLAAVPAHAQSWPNAGYTGEPCCVAQPYGTVNNTPTFGIYAPRPAAPAPTFYAPQLPSPPTIRSYIPAPSQGPSGYPCTMPGCR
jgi:hypothetical protein